MSLSFFPDTTALINFAHTNRLPLLAELLPDPQWCEVVSQECAESSRVPGLQNLVHACDIFGAPLTPTETEREATFRLRDLMRRPGGPATQNVDEAETITVITSRRIRAAFITDNHHGARPFAETKQITVITTWDLLRAAVHKKHLTLDDAYEDAQELASLSRC